MKVFIYLGLHKTGSTYLQKFFFPLYKNQCGYISLRNEGRKFLNYIVDCNDLEFDAKKGRDVFKSVLGSIDHKGNKVTFCEEILSGAPWDNAKDRVKYIKRLCKIFDDIHFIVAFRNQEDLTLSLYYEYIKKGGSAKLNEFLSYDRFALSFSKKFYLNFGDYYNFLVSQVGEEQVLSLYYEDFKYDSTSYLITISKFIGFKLDYNYKTIQKNKANPSITGLNAEILRILNKFCRTERQPFLLLPSIVQRVLLKVLVTIPEIKTESKTKIEIKNFCIVPKQKNIFLPNYKRIRKLGY